MRLQRQRSHLTESFVSVLEDMHKRAARAEAGAYPTSPPTALPGGAPGLEGLASPGAGGAGTSTDFLRDPMAYPVPIVPYLKCG